VFIPVPYILLESGKKNLHPSTSLPEPKSKLSTTAELNTHAKTAKQVIRFIVDNWRLSDPLSLLVRQTTRHLI